MKSGIKTTEFIMTVVASIIAVLVGAGLLASDQGSAVQSASGDVINAISHLVTVLAPVVSAGVYTWSRTRVKQANGKK